MASTIPITDNSLIIGDGVRYRNYRVLRFAAFRTPWSGITDTINEWLESHTNAILACPIDIQPCPTGSMWWMVLIHYYENMKMSPRR